MRDVLGTGTTLGYCTNVHPGATLPEIRANLEDHAVPIRDRLLGADDGSLGVGLWLPATAARTLREPGAAEEFAGWLAARRLDAFTFNGFPQEDFHRPVVKHAVYRPDWAAPARLAYTIDLLHILAALRGPDREGSISTLPLGWRGKVDPAAAAAALRRVAGEAARLRDTTGCLIHVDLEPEPGCHLDTAADVVAFFREHLLPDGDETMIREHIRVCHDVCHADVMFEEQADVLETYRQAGIRVGKVQLSSSPRVDLGPRSDAERRAALDALGDFGEDRYLHQTTWRHAGGGLTFHDDLPLALAGAEDAADAEWRVHYHVPLFLERLGPLDTSQAALRACLNICRATAVCAHFEVETYAWGVLPAALRGPDLARGIAEELAWVATTVAAETPS